MRTLSATCVAIALAHKGGTLRLTERRSRLGGTFIAIEDDCGVIEVADNMQDAQSRILECAR